MRDYSFGNFISALRERCGLSQTQLGALVGVSDKAVSKWENGASKPRIDTIRKLADVLDVSVDELLTCEYAAFDRKRKDLFAMKREIIKKAKDKLRELYGDNPPVSIANRFKQEELILAEHENIMWIGFLGKLQEKICKENGYFCIRNPQMSASFIAWLLNDTSVNPLRTHYYCPVCKKVEFISDVKCGIDLPDKMCTCGNRYCKDGFGIGVTNIYPLGKWIEIYVSNNMTKHVRECLYEYFEGYGEVKEIQYVQEENVIDECADNACVVTRFGVLSEEMSLTIKGDTIKIQPEEYYTKYSDKICTLTIVENKNDKLCNQDIQKIEFAPQQIKAYFDYAVENNIFIGYNRDVNMAKVIADIDNPRFSDLLILLGFAHGAGAWQNNAEYLYDKGISLYEMISCREDVYEYLYEMLSKKCCENPWGQAFEIKEAVRKGMYYHNHMPEHIEKLLLECDIPKWYVESMKKIMYLFPKTHLVGLLKRDICKFVNYSR